MNTIDSPSPARQGPSNTGNPITDFADLVACVRPYLGDGRSRPSRVVWFRRRLRKLIVEFEVAMEDSADGSPRRVIGKVYRNDRGRVHFDALSRLWQAGFRPPAPFTVVCPIAYIPERSLLLQEKAPGRPLGNILSGGDPDAQAEALVRAADGLAALHATAIDVPSRLERVRAGVARYGRELAALLPQQASRVKHLAARAVAELEPRQLASLVSSHGDFHVKNMFIADSGRLTAIDLDTFGRQERAADVAYFLAQTAIRGYFHRGSFAATAWARQCFLRAYLEAAPLPRDRLALYFGMAFLQSLHYELSVLHTKNTAIVEPWLDNAEHCLLDGRVKLLDDPVHPGWSPFCR